MVRERHRRLLPLLAPLSAFALLPLFLLSASSRGATAGVSGESTHALLASTSLQFDGEHLPQVAARHASSPGLHASAVADSVADIAEPATAKPPVELDTAGDHANLQADTTGRLEGEGRVGTDGHAHSGGDDDEETISDAVAALMADRAASMANETAGEALRRARHSERVPASWRRRREVSMTAYVRLHRAFVRAPAGTSQVEVDGRGMLPRRFLVVRPCCQLCNRVRVLISALALGMLTDRAVLISFDGAGRDGYYGRFDDLFDAPVAVQAGRTLREVCRAAPTSPNQPQHFACLAQWLTA